MQDVGWGFKFLNNGRLLACRETLAETQTTSFRPIGFFFFS